jgi:hypothetical protein
MFASGGGIRSAGGAGEGGKWRWQSAVGRGSVGRRWNIKIVETK